MLWQMQNCGSWCQSGKSMVARLRGKVGITLILPVNLGMQSLALSWESLEKNVRGRAREWPSYYMVGLNMGASPQNYHVHEKEDKT